MKDSRKAAKVSRPRAGHPPGPPWSAAERRVVQRHVQGVLTGRHAAVSAAARACVADLERLRLKTPDLPRRSYPAIYIRLFQATHGKRRAGANTPWSKGELAVLDRHVRRLVDGTYTGTAAAVRACRRELTRRWRRLSPALRGPVPRTVDGINTQMYNRVHALGWRTIRPHWSREEQAILERHVGVLFDGGYRGTREASRACWEEIGERHRHERKPGRRERRTLTAVAYRLGRLAKVRGQESR